MNRVRAGRIFFPDPVPEKIIPLGNLFRPNFGIFKVQGGYPMEKYSATLGLQPKKSVEFLGAEFVGDLQRDKQDLGHWNFTQRCLPPWPQNWFWIFFVYHVRLGVVPIFGNGMLFRKKLGPKKFIQDNRTRTIIQKWNQYQATKFLYVTSVLSRKKKFGGKSKLPKTILTCQE